MTDTLFDATLAVARALGIIRTGTSDSDGSTTTVIDSNRLERDDYFNGGTLWHIDDSEFSEITDFSSGTFTLLDALTAGTESGDRYAVAPSKYPLDWIIDAVNMALTEIRYTKVDTTSLDIVADQSEYTLPTDCHDLRRVYVELDDDSNDHRWQSVNFSVQKTATGSADTLMIPLHGFDEGDNIKLVYVTNHSAIYNDSDQIDESIKIPRIVPSACVNLLLRSLEDNNTGDKTIGQRINYWDKKAEQVALMYPMRIPMIHGNYLKLGNSTDAVELQDIPDA